MANANLVVKWLISFTKLCQSGLVFIMHSPENSYFVMEMWNYNTNMYRKCECVVKHKSLCTSFTFQIVNYRTQGIHTHKKKNHSFGSVFTTGKEERGITANM